MCERVKRLFAGKVGLSWKNNIINTNTYKKYKYKYVLKVICVYYIYAPSV